MEEARRNAIICTVGLNNAELDGQNKICAHFIFLGVKG